MAETKPVEKKESWLNWLAVTTVVFSAAATLSTFRGGGLSTKAVLAQSKASDMWAFYQAKSIKEHTYRLQAENFKAQALAATGPQAEHYQAKIEEYQKEVSRYKAEKAEIEKDARKEEETRTRCQANGVMFGVAIPYLQVAIMLSALSALMKKKPLWYIGSVLGTLGVVYFVRGYWMLYH
jgi:hypothetical protein